MKSSYNKELLHKYQKNIGINILLLLMITILSITGPLLLKNAVDYSLDHVIHLDMLGCYLLIMTLLYIIKFAYNRYHFWFSERFKNQETVHLYRNIFQMSYQKINELEPTYLTERVSSTVSTIFDLFCSSISGIFVSALTMLATLIIICQMNRTLALLYFLQIPLQYFGFQKLLNGEKSKLQQLAAKLQDVCAKNYKNIRAIVSDVNSIKQYSCREGLLNFIKVSVCEINRTERKTNRYAMDTCTVLEYVAMLLKNGSYIFIIYLYLTGNVTVGDLIYLNLMNDIYYDSIHDAIHIQINLKNLHGALRFIHDEIENNFEPDGTVPITRIDTISGSIQNVGYGDHILIEEGSFSLRRGDIVALTGASGTGKTTFVKLLNKFMTSDGILVNGYDMMSLSNASLREKIFYVPQNAYLLPYSIRENICLGENYPEARWQALEALDFMKKFLNLENGLDTIVLENASNLSGGDRQKIILGRIFLQNPDVIILDESFNSIDEKTGADIADLITALYADRILIIISHSEKYLQRCNKTLAITERKLIQTKNGEFS